MARFGKTPGLVLRAGLLALAVVMALLGVFALGALGAPCGSGDLAGVGTVERATAAGAPASSELTLRGSTTTYLFGTDITADYAAGDFVVVCGSAEGEVVAAHAIRHAQDPTAAALPYLAGAVLLFCVLALDIVVGALVRPAGAKGRGPGGFGDAFRRRGEGDLETSVRAARPGSGDNHSGAPPAKD